MVIKKVLSSNLGSHYPEQALLLTDKGEIFVTSDELTSEGYTLVPFLDLSILNSRVNAVLKGHALHGRVDALLVSGTIQVSPIASLFRVIDYAADSTLTSIEGGSDGQVITLTGSGESLTIQSNAQLLLHSDMAMANEDTLLLQRIGDRWKELSRSHNPN